MTCHDDKSRTTALRTHAVGLEGRRKNMNEVMRKLGKRSGIEKLPNLKKQSDKANGFATYTTHSNKSKCMYRGGNL